MVIAEQQSPIPPLPPSGQAPLCIFGPGGAFAKVIHASDLAGGEPAGTVLRISPALLRLAAMIARGQATIAEPSLLDAAARKALAQLACRVKLLDEALAALVDILPGDCPAQASYLIGELVAGGVADALVAKKREAP